MSRTRVYERLTKTATLRSTTTSGTDEYGNPATVETTSSVPCHARPLSTSEQTDGPAGSRWKIYLPIDVDVAALTNADRVDVDGRTFELVTKPTERYNPRTRIVEAVEAELEERS